MQIVSAYLSLCQCFVVKIKQSESYYTTIFQQPNFHIAIGGQQEKQYSATSFLQPMSYSAIGVHFEKYYSAMSCLQPKS